MAAREEIDAALAGAVDRGGVPGIVALAADDGGLLYEGAFGRREIVTGAAMTLDTVFRIASMTKAVTSVAAMQLVEQGRIDLDEPAGRFVPGLASPQLLEGFDETGRPRLRPVRRPVTLRHLLTHTAGFGYEFWNPELGRYVHATGMPTLLSGKRAALDLPLLFDPGERWNYGINTDWVGLIVEEVGGERLDAYCRDRIIEPLGMADTAFAPNAEQLSRLATIHRRKPDGGLEPVAVELRQEAEYVSGGGGLYSTGPDYLRFLRALMAGGGPVLRPETVAAMAKNQIGDLPAGKMRAALPEWSNDLDLFPDGGCGWGLGFLVNRKPGPEGRAAGSLTWAGIFNSYYWLDPTNRIAGVILTQILPFADPTVLALLGEFERGVYRALTPA
jgi:methyl acetate hydrolase